MSWNDRAAFAELTGVTLSDIDRDGNEKLTFRAQDGREWIMYHSQDCCESVELADVAGELADLIGSPILLAEEVCGDNGEVPEGGWRPEYPDSFTWTFYKLATVKGHVTLRWLGESNGYYSESVDFERGSGHPDSREGRDHG